MRRFWLYLCRKRGPQLLLADIIIQRTSEKATEVISDAQLGPKLDNSTIDLYKGMGFASWVNWGILRDCGSLHEDSAAESLRNLFCANQTHKSCHGNKQCYSGREENPQFVPNYTSKEIKHSERAERISEDVIFLETVIGPSIPSHLCSAAPVYLEKVVLDYWRYLTSSSLRACTRILLNSGVLKDKTCTEHDILEVLLLLAKLWHS